MATAPQSPPDYYALLGLPRQASQAQIAQAYKAQLARLGRSREDEYRMNQLLDAYSILKDPELRAAYDARLPKPPRPTLAQRLGLSPRSRKPHPSNGPTLTQLMDFDWESVEEEEPDTPAQRKAVRDELWFKALVIAVVLGVVGFLFWLTEA